MFQIGEKVRLTPDGKRAILRAGHGPKAVLFYFGEQTVRGTDGEYTQLHYPVGLDIENGRTISADRIFNIETIHLERV